MVVRKKDSEKNKSDSKAKVEKKKTKEESVIKDDKDLKKNNKIKKEKPEVKKQKTSDRTVMLRELKEKAAKLAAGIEGIETEEIKEELAKKRKMLIPLEDYVKTGIHLGTKVITPDMKKFVYRRRADSIGVLDTGLIDEHLKKAIDLMAKFEPEQIILVCKREAGRETAKLLEQVTGIRAFTSKYPGGMLTNIQLEEFYEPELVIITDSWIDRNALKDAKKTNKKIIMLCDTNNYIKNADLIIPCNNKGEKSLALIFYLLAKGYSEKKKLKNKMPTMSMFVGEDL